MIENLNINYSMIWEIESTENDIISMNEIVPKSIIDNYLIDLLFIFQFRFKFQF